MDSLLQQLVEMVQSQTFPHREELFAAITAGQCTVGDLWISETSVSHFLAIYRRRLGHLAKKRSRHAKALANDVAWFCSNLETAPQASVEIWVVDIDPPYQLEFFLEGHTKMALGCMKTVSKLKVTPGEWKRLWADDVLDT